MLGSLYYLRECVCPSVSFSILSDSARAFNITGTGRSTLLKSRLSVGVALGYGLDDRSSTVRFPAGAGNFSLHHRVQNGSGAHTASYQMGTRGSFLEGKAAGAWSWPLTSI
jgi:hypothetical protein